MTVAVGDLKPGAVTAALDAGREVAAVLERAGLICAAVLVLRQHYRVAGEVPAGLIAATAA